MNVGVEQLVAALNVEREFVHTLYLGESVARFRLLQPVLAVIPWDERRNELMDATARASATNRSVSLNHRAK